MEAKEERKLNKLTISLILVLVLLSSYTLLSPFSPIVIADEKTQVLDLGIEVYDSNGIVSNANIKIFELSVNGPVKLSEGYTNVLGTYKTRLFLKRKLVNIIENKEIYASINLWIIAYSKDKNELGTLTFSVDPTFLKHPIDEAGYNIRLKKLNSSGKLASFIDSSKTPKNLRGSSPPYPPYQENSWAFTKVLVFSTWDNISARVYYVTGSKINVESKERVYDLTSSSYETDWYSSGTTTVTLNSGITHPNEYYPPISGRYVYTLKFEFCYCYVTTWLDPGSKILEMVYAADTDNDPRSYTVDSISWSGSLPSSSYYYDILQRDSRDIPITGGSEYYLAWSVGVSVTFAGVGVGVSLGVGKQSSPNSYLRIYAGTWVNNSYKVRTVSLSGNTFLESYSNWIKQ
ncbi:MAG: hypothetical protein ACPLRT_06835 [Thermoproteota archaeon]